MIFGVATVVAVLITVIMFSGGLVSGAVGFGFGLVSTAALAAILDPQQAVVLMIVPVFATNIPLVFELEPKQLRYCARRFLWFILASALGTIVGMVVIDQVPTAALTLGLGLFTVAYVVLTQEVVDVPSSSQITARVAEHHTAAQLSVGLSGGFIFGATNVGVPVITYLDRLDLRRSIFVGVAALILLGVSAIRIGTAWLLDLYASGGVLWLSIGATVPALLGVAGGQRIRHVLPDQYVETGVRLLLAIIGLRLIMAGL